MWASALSKQAFASSLEDHPHSSSFPVYALEIDPHISKILTLPAIHYWQWVALTLNLYVLPASVDVLCLS